MNWNESSARGKYLEMVEKTKWLKVRGGEIGQGKSEGKSDAESPKSATTIPQDTYERECLVRNTEEEEDKKRPIRNKIIVYSLTLCFMHPNTPEILESIVHPLVCYLSQLYSQSYRHQQFCSLSRGNPHSWAR